MGSPPMIECLCEELANINGDVLPGVSALDLTVACGGDPSIVSSLYDYGASKDIKAKTSEAPLRTPETYIPKIFSKLKLQKRVRQRQEILKPDHLSLNKEQGKINDGNDFVSLDRPNSVHDFTQVGNISASHRNEDNNRSQVSLPLINTGEGKPDQCDWAVYSTSLSEEDYEEIIEESSVDTNKQMNEKESGIYYEVPKIEDGSKEEKEKSNRGDLAYINIGPQMTEQQKKNYSPTSAKPRPKPRQFMKSLTDVPGGIMSSEPDSTEPQSDTVIAKERNPARLQCAHLEENTVVAETFPEEQVVMRENPGRRSVTGVMRQLPRDMPVCCVFIKHVHKYYGPVQQTIRKATNVSIKSKMNITGGNIPSSDSSSPCSTYTSSSNVSSGRSHLLDSSPTASLQE